MRGAFLRRFVFHDSCVFGWLNFAGLGLFIGHGGAPAALRGRALCFVGATLVRLGRGALFGREALDFGVRAATHAIMFLVNCRLSFRFGLGIKLRPSILSWLGSGIFFVLLLDSSIVLLRRNVCLIHNIFFAAVNLYVTRINCVAWVDLRGRSDLRKLLLAPASLLRDVALCHCAVWRARIWLALRRCWFFFAANVILLHLVWVWADFH